MWCRSGFVLDNWMVYDVSWKHFIGMHKKVLHFFLMIYGDVYGSMVCNNLHFE